MISIIVPIYNAELFIEDCVKSLLKQTYNDIEIILVNDGSDDNSLKLCYDFVKFGRVKVFDQLNAGVSSARNHGIDNASGDYLMFVDADDELPNDAIQNLLSCTDKTIDCVVGNFADKYGDVFLERKLRLPSGEYDYTRLLPEFIDDGTLKGFTISSTCAALYKSSIIKEYNIRFDENVRINEDGLFNLDYALKAKRVKVMDKVVYYVRKHEESSSHTRSSDYDFNTPVVSHLYSILWDKEKYNLELQLKRRNVTIAIWNILTYPRGQSFAEGISTIKKITDDPFLEKSYQYIAKDRLPLYKKVIFVLMRHKCNFVLCFMIQKLLPVLSKYIAR